MQRKIITLSILLSVVLLFTACTPTGETVMPTDTPVPVEVEEADEAEHQEDMDGEDNQDDTGGEEHQESSDTDMDSSVIDASALYALNCARCHGDDRSGGRAPALLPERLTGDASQYAKTISNGRGGMPSWSSK